MKKNPEVTISYEPEADVLMYKLSGKPIDSAREIGNVIIHVTKDEQPVLIEILEAKKFLATMGHLVESKRKKMRVFTGSKL